MTPEAASTELPSMALARARLVLRRVRTDPGGVPADLLVERAARFTVPLLLVGDTPAVRHRLARAVHAVGARSGPLRVVSPVADATPRRDGTVMIEFPPVLGPPPTWLEYLLDDGEPWTLFAAECVADVPAGLRIRSGLAVLALERATPDTVEAIARDMLDALTGPIGDPPILADEAVAWLVRTAAAHDLEVLGGLLRRALLLTGPGGVVRVHELTGEASPDVSDDPAPPPAARDSTRLEYVLAELAHELRNPMVTLQTLADHLDDLAADPELRERFGALAADAVARMDGLLENLVSYGRLGDAVPRSLSVEAALTAAIHDATSVLGDRQVTVRGLPPNETCFADPDHLSYAFKNLLIGVAQATPANADVVVDATTSGLLRVQLASNGHVGTLQRLLAADPTEALYDPTCQPLPLTLARAVLAQTGGRLEVAAADAGATLDVYLPRSTGAA